MLEGLPLPATIAIFAVAAVVVWLAGTRLARYADGIADATGIGHALAGMMLLGGITSLPELAVAITSSVRGVPALTVNNVLGSAAFNLVILALADALSGRDAITSIQGSPRVMLQGVLGMIMLALVVAPSLTGDVAVLGMGISSWVVLATVIAALRVVSSSRAEDAWQTTGPDAPDRDDSDEPRKPLRTLVLGMVALGAVILVAGFFLTLAGEAVAEQSGLGTSFFAVVFLALATSLPDVSTIYGAVRIRRYTLAVSELFGTNILNVAIIVLADAIHPGGPVVLEVGPTASAGALLGVLLTGIFLVGLLERRDRTVLRMGIDSLLVLLVYGAGLVVLYRLR